MIVYWQTKGSYLEGQRGGIDDKPDEGDDGLALSAPIAEGRVNWRGIDQLKGGCGAFTVSEIQVQSQPCLTTRTPLRETLLPVPTMLYVVGDVCWTHLTQRVRCSAHVACSGVGAVCF